MKEENDTYFQIQPSSEKSKKYNLRTNLKIELVNFNKKKELPKWFGTQRNYCKLLNFLAPSHPNYSYKTNYIKDKKESDKLERVIAKQQY